MCLIRSRRSIVIRVEVNESSDIPKPGHTISPAQNSSRCNCCMN